MMTGDSPRNALLKRLEELRAEMRGVEEELYPGRPSVPSQIPVHTFSRLAADADVSCRVFVPFLADLEGRGKIDQLLRGLRLSPDELADPKEWITWDQFCAVCRNMQELWTDEEVIQVGHRLTDQPEIRELKAFAPVLRTASELYEWVVHRFFGPMGLLFRCVRTEHQGLGPGAHGLQITLPEGYRANPLFFKLMASWLQVSPRFAGVNDAQVFVEVTSGGAAYEIHVSGVFESGPADDPDQRLAELEPEQASQLIELLVERNQTLERHAVQRERDMWVLRDSEKRFRVLSELTNDYGFMAQVVDGALVCEWITGSHARTTGYGSGELLLMGVHGIVHAEDRKNLTEAIAAIERGEHVQHEYRILTRMGEIRWVREHLRPELYSDGLLGPVFGAVRDVTERHHAQREQEALEEQLRQSQKMDAVGRLAGGIAHDFNNLLTVIITHVGFLLKDLAANTQAHDDASDIQQAARRAAGLTQRLLTFSRQQVVMPTVLELNLVIRELESMLNSLVGEGIELDIQLDPRQSCINMDRAQLEQILLNLVVNARDSMAQGGRVTIATGEVDLGEAFVRAHPDSRPGRHVALGVRDTGGGMEEAVMARIFEPFFSTKPPDKGTGLGLSTVYGIVRQAGGSINVESKLGFGTTFEIYFPVAEGVMTHDPSIRPKRLKSRNSETILVVEDEEGVRRGVQRILKHAGYNVLVAADPAQALTIVEEYDGHIDLLLTDVVMPMMNGVQLAERVTAMRSDILVLYMSGYTSDSVETGTALEEIAFLHKPFTRQAMLAKVEDVLGQGGGDLRRASGDDSTS